jgi:iron(III) transport system substrate-binding protein
MHGMRFAVIFLLGFLGKSEWVSGMQEQRPLQSQIVEGAKKEAKLSVYGPSTGRLLTTPEGKKFIGRFKEKYPFLEVDFVRVSAIRLMDRISTEYKTGRYLADVITTSATNYYPLLKEKLVGKYLSPESKAIPADLKDSEGYWTSTFVAAFTIAYNTRLLSEQDAPKSYDELLLPKWKGRKIGVDEGNSLRWSIAQSTREGKEKTLSYMKRLAIQDPFVTSGGSTLLIQLLSAGEFILAHAATTHSVQTAKELGAPVAWVKTKDPHVTIPVLIGIAARPSHPNAAKLYIDFTLSEEGQQLLSPVFQIPARRGIESEPPGLLKGLNVYSVRPEAFEKFDEDQKNFRNMFFSANR